MSNAAPPAERRTHEFTSKSGADTIEVGRKLAKYLTPPQLLILRGDLGTGKTTLVKGIAKALDAAEADEDQPDIHPGARVRRDTGRQAGKAIPPRCVSS